MCGTEICKLVHVLERERDLKKGYSLRTNKNTKSLALSVVRAVSLFHSAVKVPLRFELISLLRWPVPLRCHDNYFFKKAKVEIRYRSRGLIHSACLVSEKPV